MPRVDCLRAPAAASSQRYTAICPALRRLSWLCLPVFRDDAFMCQLGSVCRSLKSVAFRLSVAQS